MPNLLLELFSEEIPARMQTQAAEDLANALCGELRKAGYADIHNKTFVTPRRLAIQLTDLPVAQADTFTERKGPRADAPQAALDGFLRSTGLMLEQLENRGGVYFANIHSKGRPTVEVLKETIESILHHFPWPKSMRWGGGEVRWVRPLHNILCLFGEDIVPVQFGGLTANNFTYGHRFLAPQNITIYAADADYANILHDAFVITDFAFRKETISKQAQSLAAEKNCGIVADDGLLNEVTGLVEWPVALIGSIDAEFMELPREVLISVMRTHQKYFALTTLSPASGRGQRDLSACALVAAGEGAVLAPYFITISNRSTADSGNAIIAGNERVLRARFSDGKFFWDQDRKKPLAKWAEGLKDVTYHAKLGSIADKVKRITELALKLADYVNGADKAKVERAAQLCKADLVTGMVGEFAELQGIMGRYYALHQGEDAQVADAIRDQYIHAKERLPTAAVSICIALADRLDTLMGMFAINEKPTGSKDPFALRRAAITMLQIILKNNIRIPLPSLIPQNPNEIMAFFADRLEVILREEGIGVDRIRAVFSTGEDDLVRLTARTRALQVFLTSEDGANLLAAYKRASNILKIEEKKDSTAYRSADLDKAILQEKAEITLADSLQNIAANIPALLAAEKFADIMAQLAHLRAPVDAFFTDIMVNCDNKTLRTHRLRLLAAIRENMDTIADFGKVEG